MFGYFTDEQMTFDEVCNLKEGDKFLEDVTDGFYEATVVSSPVVKDGNEVTFVAKDNTGLEINFLLSKDHYHYAPKLYTHENIIVHNGDNWVQLKNLKSKTRMEAGK